MNNTKYLSELTKIKSIKEPENLDKFYKNMGMLRMRDRLKGAIWGIFLTALVIAKATGKI